MTRPTDRLSWRGMRPPGIAAPVSAGAFYLQVSDFFWHSVVRLGGPRERGPPSEIAGEETASCEASHRATTHVRANRPRRPSIKKVGTGKLSRAMLWRIAAKVGNPSATRRASPLSSGPWRASRSARIWSSNVLFGASWLMAVTAGYLPKIYAAPELPRPLAPAGQVKLSRIKLNIRIITRA